MIVIIEMAGAAMRTVREPTSEEQTELERMTRQEVGRVALRAQMVLLSARGYSVPEISTIQGISDVTIYGWLDRFEAEGPAGLYDRPRPGRPPKIDAEAEQCLMTALEQTPEAYGYPATVWTTPLLRDLLRCRCALSVCADTVRRAVHALDYRWRRPRWAVQHSDPDGAYRLDRLRHALETATVGTVCLVQDETKFRTLPPLRRMWMRRGDQVRVPTPKQNHHVFSYGALNLVTGAWHDRLTPKANSEATLTFLNDLLGHYPKQRILLIWDQARYHTSHQVETWLRQHPRITALLLPKYEPQLNPVEHIWRVVKQRVAANVTRTLEAIQKAYRTFFEQQSPASLLQTAALAA
jgi:transposase